jgi:ligand-binding sensor domain-containing protein/signal transduction histidine kinase
MIAANYIFAQDYIFRQLRIEDGLSQSTIFASLQDKEGFMWFATRSGLNRFDGYKFNVYYNDPKDSTSLSDDGTNSLYVDRSGVLWIGTIYGNLNRFDKNSETFSYINVSSLIKNIPDQKDDFYEYPLSFSRNQSTTITSITEDQFGFLWVGTWGKGMLRLDKNFKLLNHFYSDGNEKYSLTSNRIMDLHFDDKGRLWIATFGGGLIRITGLSKNPDSDISIETLNESEDLYSLTDNKLLTLFQDSDKNIWIGSFYGGLIQIDNTQIDKPFGSAIVNCERCPLTFKRSSERNTVIAITEDLNKNLWIGTFGGGLIRYDKRKGESKHFFNDPLNQNSLGDNDVLSLSVDRSGIIWAGSHLGAGITIIRINNAKFNLIKHSPGKNNTLNDNVVWSIYKDKENIFWVGTYKGGLNRIDLTRNTYSFFMNQSGTNSLSSNHIRVIKEDAYGNLWIGTYDGGLNIFNKKTFKTIVYKNDPNDPVSISSNQIQDIFIESDSVYWIASFGGGLIKAVIRGNPISSKLSFTFFRNDKDENTSISDNRVYKIFRSKDGAYWIGTYGGGLNQFNPANGKFKRYPINSGQQDNFNIENLMTIEEDSDGIIWLGSYGGSLTSFDRKQNKFKRYSFREGITSGVVYGILEDNNKTLWISSDDGIFKLDLNNKAVSAYNIQDGLQSLEFSGGAYFKDSDGRLYFGGINGLNYFNPVNIKSNKYKPSIVITSFKVFNETVKGFIKEITLDHTKNFLSFEFSSLDYTDPTDNQYSYILEGLQSEWQTTDASKRAANYTNLSPGTYTFKVKGSNSDGVWSDNYASIKIIILHPFWQTWWFLTISIALVAALLYYLSTVRIKNLLAIEKLKSKLAADLHDNIGSGLTEISILSEVASRKMNSINIVNGNELNKISDISRQLVDNMSDIVWVVNPKRDSLHDLILRLKDSYSDLLLSLGISFKSLNLDKLEDVKLPMEVKQNLYLIFKEAINNAIKHSMCKHITLEANVRNDIIEIVLQDDGKGFDESKVVQGNGLKNIVNRAKYIGGKIKIKSDANSGTSIRFIGKAGINNLLNFFYNR